MDILIGILCVTIAIVSAVIIYIILVSSMKEKTYDEVKAEQKKKVDEYLAQGRSVKERAKDKKLKKAGKKVKDKASSEPVEISSEEVENIKSHVTFVETPIVEAVPVLQEDIEVKAIESSLTDSLLSNKHYRLRHISPKETKMEKSQVRKQTQHDLKPTEKFTTPSKLNEKPQERSHIQTKLVDEVLKSSTKPNPSALSAANNDVSSSSRSSRKKRHEIATLQQMGGEREAVNVNLLMPLVLKAELSRTEIQILIDLLLNKQQSSTVDSAEWIEGRQDPVVKLKKQLAEKEKALVEEQEAAAALQSKLKDLRSELNAEKHSTRQLEENLQARHAELGNMGGRLQHSVEEKQGLLQQVQQLQGKLNEEHMLVCKLQEEQGQTQNLMQQELLAQRQQLEMHIARLTEQHQETISTLEGQVGQIASQLQEVEAVNNSLSGELVVVRERGAHLQESAAQSQDLARQVKDLHSEIERLMTKSQYDTKSLQGEVNSLTEQLNLKLAESDKLNSMVHNLQSENNRLTHQISSACIETQQLRDENETLAAQVTATMERPATEGRENGDVMYTERKHIHNNSDRISEKELIVEQLKCDIISKEKEVNHLKTELAQQEALINSLKVEIDVVQSHAEKMLKEINSYKSLVQEQESVINALREEGDSAHKLVSTMREDICKNKAEIIQLSKDCATREQLEIRENMIEKLTSELNTHKTKLADQEGLIQTLQRELDKYKAGLDDSGKQQLIHELNTYKGELIEKESMIKSLMMQANNNQADIKTLKSELVSSKDTVNMLSPKMKDYEEKQASLFLELEIQKRKNDEAEGNARLEEQRRTKEFLQRLLPHISIDNTQDYGDWLEQFMVSASESLGKSENSNESDATMLAEVEQQNCQLQAMVTHYKAIIADTEGMLNRLQSHVEQEEGRWGQQIQTLELQLEAVIQERDKLLDGSDTN